MTSLAPDTATPELTAFDDETAPLRGAMTSSLALNEEMRLRLLSGEIVRYLPGLARQLHELGVARLQAELAEA
jgi:hypothetical protein